MSDTKIKSSNLPVIDVTELIAGTAAQEDVARQIGAACRDMGFFYVTGHGIDERLQSDMEDLSKKFFAQDLEEKMRIQMKFGGRAWRGYFPVGGELTSGKPDMKEGIYFGAELSDNHPMVLAGAPVHGKNLFPAIENFKETVLAYMDAQTRLGHALMRGIALSLQLPANYFELKYTADPLVLFRIFNYPYVSDQDSDSPSWGVGEHTDYGVLTILKQDDAGGLEVKSTRGWIAAPPLKNTFVCNIGDMLDRMTRGLYRSTPHRVRNPAPRDRLSFPFFFDPNFNAKVEPIETIAIGEFQDDRESRWDKASVHELSGTYGDYLLSKVSKVFPDLRKAVL